MLDAFNPILKHFNIFLSAVLMFAYPNLLGTKGYVVVVVAVLMFLTFYADSGIMKIGQEYISLAAHLSNQACKEVQELSLSLPALMKVTKYSKLKAWPGRWKASKPSAECIGLYFFSDNMRCVTYRPTLWTIACCVFSGTWFKMYLLLL
jgi:hypothetical protein